MIKVDLMVMIIKWEIWDMIYVVYAIYIIFVFMCLLLDLIKNYLF